MSFILSRNFDTRTNANIYNSTRLRNIEDTERAKRKLIDETEREEKEPKQHGKVT